MTEQKSKKLSRRDAMKVLGAAFGGAALSTIPPKWSKPALAASQLPVHARQSANPAVCTQNSLLAEFIATTNGNFGSGGVVLNVPFDSTTSAGGPPLVGDQFTWNCTHTGCFSGSFQLDGTSGGGNPVVTMRLTTFSGATQTVVWNLANQFHSISVNFNTGAIAVDGCAAGCTCP